VGGFFFFGGGGERTEKKKKEKAADCNFDPNDSPLFLTPPTQVEEKKIVKKRRGKREKRKLYNNPCFTVNFSTMHHYDPSRPLRVNPRTQGGGRFPARKKGGVFKICFFFT